MSLSLIYRTNFIDLQHHLFTLTLGGKLYLSPLQRDDKPLGRVLDAGTGTGVWAIDFADAHPETQVTCPEPTVITA